MLLPYILAPDLELRLMETHHAEALFAIIDRDRAYLRRWQNWPDHINTLDDVYAMIERADGRRANHNGFDLLIWSDGELAGKIGLVYVDWQDRVTEIGYWISQPYQGRGLVTRACRALLDEAFDWLLMNETLIRCASGNLRSRAIPERLGFSLSAAVTPKTWLRGRQIDEVLYSMTRHRWHTLKQG